MISIMGVYVRWGKEIELTLSGHDEPESASFLSGVSSFPTHRDRIDRLGRVKGEVGEREAD